MPPNYEKVIARRRRGHVQNVRRRNHRLDTGAKRARDDHIIDLTADDDDAELRSNRGRFEDDGDDDDVIDLTADEEERVHTLAELILGPPASSSLGGGGGGGYGSLVDYAASSTSVAAGSTDNNSFGPTGPPLEWNYEAHESSSNIRDGGREYSAHRVAECFNDFEQHSADYAVLRGDNGEANEELYERAQRSAEVLERFLNSTDPARFHFDNEPKFSHITHLVFAARGNNVPAITERYAYHNFGIAYAVVKWFRGHAANIANEYQRTGRTIPAYITGAPLNLFALLNIERESFDDDYITRQYTDGPIVNTHLTFSSYRKDMSNALRDALYAESEVISSAGSDSIAIYKNRVRRTTFSALAHRYGEFLDRVLSPPTRPAQIASIVRSLKSPPHTDEQFAGATVQSSNEYEAIRTVERDALRRHNLLDDDDDDGEQQLQDMHLRDDDDDKIDEPYTTPVPTPVYTPGSSPQITLHGYNWEIEDYDDEFPPAAAAALAAEDKGSF